MGTDAAENRYEKIEAAYNEVFDENGETKRCGRNKCIWLMILLQKEFPDVNFGNTNTGFMYADTIKEYYNICKERNSLNSFKD